MLELAPEAFVFFLVCSIKIKISISTLQNYTNNEKEEDDYLFRVLVVAKQIS